MSSSIGTPASVFFLIAFQHKISTKKNLQGDNFFAFDRSDPTVNNNEQVHRKVFDYNESRIRPKAYQTQCGIVKTVVHERQVT